MKILLTSESYKFQTNGVTNVIVALEKQLRAMGHEVKVLSLSNKRKSFKINDEYYIKSFPLPIYPDLDMSFSFFDPLLDELIDWHPDIVHVHTEFFTFVMAKRIIRKYHLPYVMTVHTDYEEYLFGSHNNANIIEWDIKKWGQATYGKADKVIAPSEKIRDLPQLKGVGDITVVIPNGIDLNKYKKTLSSEDRKALYEQYNLKDNGKLIAVISRLSKEKNIHEILDYFKKLSDIDNEVQLIVVGDGPEKEKLIEHSKKLNIENIRFTGRIDPSEIYKYYGIADLFTSGSTFEVHSLTYLEAMAMGLPLLCRKDKCLKGVLDDGFNGYAYRDLEEYLKYAQTILNDNELKKKMRENALNRVLEFSDVINAQKVYEVYEEAIKNHNK